MKPEEIHAKYKKLHAELREIDWDARKGELRPRSVDPELPRAGGTESANRDRHPNGRQGLGDSVNHDPRPTSRREPSYARL